MTGKDKHMPLYSSSDIEKYLSGELSDPEMHAMERAALDDPFLADALEGMVFHRNLPEQPSFRQDMDSLQKRLDDRVSGNKKRSLILPLAVRYAAAVVLLLGIGVTVWYTFADKKMKTPLASSRVEVPAANEPATKTARMDTVRMDTARIIPADALAGERAIDKNQWQFTKKEEAINTARKFKKGRAKDTIDNKDIASSYRNDLSNTYKQPAAPYANNLNTIPNTQKSILSDSLFAYNNNKNSTPFRIRGLASGVAIQKEAADPEVLKKSADQLVFTGKVLNTQNIPLAGATLSFKKGQDYFKTATDANGYFTLSLPKYDTTTRTIAVNYVGYEPAIMKLNTDDKAGNVILLKPQTASLNEVVVVGYGAKRKELTRMDINSVPPPLSQIAVPTDGWSAYTNYLESNKNSAGIDTTIRGYESISFIVSKKGELSHFKVERSLSTAHDSLAIRLVKDGPSWKLLKGSKQKARVILTW